MTPINIYLMGGGTRLSAHLGALDALREADVQVEGWAGASGGSIIATTLALGFSPQAAQDLMLRTNFKQFLDFRPFSFWRSFGIYAGDRLETWLATVFEGKKFRDTIIPLSIVCTDVATGRPIILSSENTPDVSLARAVRCSVSIPGIFAVRKIGPQVLIDGSMAQVDETELFPNRQAPIATIRLVRDRSAKLAQTNGFNLTSYVRQVATLLLDASEDVRVAADRWKTTLIIKTGQHSSLNFDLSRDDKLELMRMGYEQCRQYLLQTNGVLGKT